MKNRRGGVCGREGGKESEKWGGEFAANNGTSVPEFAVAGRARLRPRREGNRRPLQRGQRAFSPGKACGGRLREQEMGRFPPRGSAARGGRGGCKPPHRERGAAPFPARTEPRPPRADLGVQTILTRGTPMREKKKGLVVHARLVACKMRAVGPISKSDSPIRGAFCAGGGRVSRGIWENFQGRGGAARRPPGKTQTETILKGT